VGLIEFYNEVKAEALKVTWPSRKEVMMAVGLVLFLATLAGVFFLMIDAVLFKLVQFILGV
jgi:preprotein translocase subunit SecE